MFRRLRQPNPKLQSIVTELCTATKLLCEAYTMLIYYFNEHYISFHKLIMTCNIRVQIKCMHINWIATNTY